MATLVEMPKLSDTMKTGKLISWLVKEGDTVDAGSDLAELESDKATMEMQVYDGGVVRKLLVKEGDDIAVGAPIAIIADDADEDISDLLSSASSGGDSNGASAPKADPAPEKEVKEASKAASKAAAPAPQKAAPKSAPKAAQKPAAPTPSTSSDDRVKASPLARRMATDMGLQLQAISGSGPGGRVVKSDVERAQADGSALPQAAAASPAGAPVGIPARKGPEPLPTLIGGGSLGGEVSAAVVGEAEDHPLTKMRDIISRRLLESKVTIPHFYVTVEVRMEKVEAMREQLKNLGHRVSINDIIIKASALALTKFPMVNASFQGDKITSYNQIDVGVAVSVDDGLLVPVVRQANLKGLSAIAGEVRDLAKRARAGKLLPNEMGGGTFSISNLGMFGVENFSAIINPPESAILAVGAALDKPVVEHGAIVPGRIMKMNLSADHRVVDGALAAQFLAELKSNLENPLTLAL